MDLHGRTVLLTGGSSGIGLALAQRFVRAGSRVIVTGRRDASLAAARAACPGLETLVNDVGSEVDRARLASHLRDQKIPIDVLINNAGIQNRVDPTRLEAWAQLSEEIRINLEGPIHLTSLLLPLLHERAQAYVVNVSSGLAFVPLAGVPIYSATKAGIHSFTQSLRHALAPTNVRVIEIIPPAVRSNLGGSHDFGVPTEEYADSVMRGLAEDREEIAYQFSQRASQASRAELDAMFVEMNARRS
ncbi:MAG TPA: SDR family NAD(P)-dependent oxidoreductase [Polyangiaceae bacterium]|nr:SDR family NAD(P)-dependent oxidoreductase [Polyangiaceae bacterium]